MKWWSDHFSLIYSKHEQRWAPSLTPCGPCAEVELHSLLMPVYILVRVVFSEEQPESDWCWIHIERVFAAVCCAVRRRPGAEHGDDTLARPIGEQPILKKKYPDAERLHEFFHSDAIILANAVLCKLWNNAFAFQCIQASSTIWIRNAKHIETSTSTGANWSVVTKQG